MLLQENLAGGKRRVIAFNPVARILARLVGAVKVLTSVASLKLTPRSLQQPEDELPPRPRLIEDGQRPAGVGLVLEAGAHPQPAKGLETRGRRDVMADQWRIHGVQHAKI